MTARLGEFKATGGILVVGTKWRLWPLWNLCLEPNILSVDQPSFSKLGVACKHGCSLGAWDLQVGGRRVLFRCRRAVT